MPTSARRSSSTSSAARRGSGRPRQSSWRPCGRSSTTAASAVPNLGRENMAALQKGIVNLDRHVDNVRDVYRAAMPGRDQPSRRGHRRRTQLDRRPRLASWHQGDRLASLRRGQPRRRERREGGRRALRAPELFQVRLRRKGDALGQDEDHRDAHLRRIGDHRRREDPRPDQGAAGFGLRPLPGLRCEDAVFVLDRSAASTARRTDTWSTSGKCGSRPARSSWS